MEQEKAYAKINLFLDVTGKRPDGFHTIRSVMQSVSLADDITLSVTPSDYTCITLSMPESDIPTDERNLAYLAAEYFLDYIGMSAAVSITIKKNIPSSAGLAGGSSDAAAVLRAINRALGAPLSAQELCQIGEKIGADVPFCIMGGTRLCLGKGEQMESYPDILEGYTLVVCSIEEEKMATPAAYARLDEAFEDFAEDNIELHDLLFSYFKEDEIGAMYNIFESVVLPECIPAAVRRTELIAAGARNAMMSGSGTAVFGIFDTDEEAKKAAEAIPGAVVCHAVKACL